MPRICIGATSPAEPIFGSVPPVSGCARSCAVHFLLKATAFSLSCTLISCSPEATMPFIRLLPNTAPTPARPAARSPLMTEAYFTRFSPAGPMDTMPHFVFFPRSASARF